MVDILTFGAGSKHWASGRWNPQKKNMKGYLHGIAFVSNENCHEGKGD